MYRIVLFSKAKIKKKHIECIIFHIKIVKRLPSHHDLTQVVGVASCYRNVLFINFLFRLNINETAKFWQSHFSYILPLPSYIGIGPCPKQLVVVTAVRKAVSAATTIFTAISISRFFFIISHCLLANALIHVRAS